MDTRKAKMQVYLHPPQVEALRAQASRSRLPVAMLIRDAVDDYLEARDASGALKLVRPSSPRRKVGGR